jgi:hypothetical protein
MRIVFAVSAAISLLAAAPTANADEGSRGSDGWRRAFVGSAITTAVMLTGSVVAANRVRAREDEKDDLLRTLQDSDPGNPILRANTVCDAAAGESSAIARDLSSTCSSGRRWATVTNIFYLGTAAAAVFTGYAFYRGYVKRTGSERVRVTPAVGRDGAGVTVSLGF